MRVTFSEQKLTDDLENLLKEVSSEKSNLSFHEIDSFNGRTCVFRIFGGLNGDGLWSDYLSDMSKFLDRLSSVYKSANLISIESDSIDDVFEALIKIRF